MNEEARTKSVCYPRRETIHLVSTNARLSRLFENLVGQTSLLLSQVLLHSSSNGTLLGEMFPYGSICREGASDCLSAAAHCALS